MMLVARPALALAAQSITALALRGNLSPSAALLAATLPTKLERDAP
jgi:hypothetical protein